MTKRARLTGTSRARAAAPRRSHGVRQVAPDSSPPYLLRGMRLRQFVALLALVNLFVAAYLALWKAGLAGTLACGTGGCETVQLSQWGWFLGVDVAQWGVLFYLTVLGVMLWGTLPGREDARPPALALAGLALWGVGFTVRLKYAEWFILKTLCPWCLVSAVSVVLLAVAAVVEWRRTAPRPG